MTTTGSGFATLRKLIEQRSRLAGLDVRWICSWHDQPTYLQALATLIQGQLDKFDDPAKVHIVFSAHSIPERYVQEGDPYLDQTRETVELIVKRFYKVNPYHLSFQSKIGPVKWLEPSTNDVIVELGNREIAGVLLVPISFVSEHIETLYELDILYRKVAAEAGIRNFRRVPALNCHPIFIRALAEIVEVEMDTNQ